MLPQRPLRDFPEIRNFDIDYFAPRRSASIVLVVAFRIALIAETLAARWTLVAVYFESPFVMRFTFKVLHSNVG